MRPDAPRDINRPIALSLITGMMISVVLILVGDLLLLLNPDIHINAVLPVGKAICRVIRFDPAGWLSLGIFVLILTPFARVAIAVLSFARIRDWKYTVVSLVVLLMMMVGLLLGKG